MIQITSYGTRLPSLNASLANLVPCQSPDAEPFHVAFCGEVSRTLGVKFKGWRVTRARLSAFSILMNWSTFRCHKKKTLSKGGSGCWIGHSFHSGDCGNTLYRHSCESVWLDQCSSLEIHSLFKLNSMTAAACLKKKNKKTLLACHDSCPNQMIARTLLLCGFLNRTPHPEDAEGGHALNTLDPESEKRLSTQRVRPN